MVVGSRSASHLAQILSALHEGLSKHRIHFLKRTGVAHHGGLHGHGGDRVIKHLQLRIVLRQRLRIVRKQLHERLHPLRRKPGKLRQPLRARRSQHALDGIAHTDIALDRPLDIRLRQTLVDPVHLPGHPLGNGIDVRRRAADIHTDQLPDAGRFVRSLRQQRHGLHDRRRRRHHRAAHALCRGVQALCLHDAAQENAADGLLRVLRFEHAEFRHDVFADGYLEALQRLPALLHGRAVARENDWELRADRGEHLRVMNDAGAVAAVRAADQKKNVRVHALNGFQIVLRQLE